MSESPTGDEVTGDATSPAPSRRKFLRYGAAAGGGVILGGAVGASAGNALASPKTKTETKTVKVNTTGQVLHFRSAPDLDAPPVQVAVSRSKSLSAAVAAGDHRHYLITPKRYQGGSVPSKSGAMIVDARGHLVWFEPSAPEIPMNLKMQTYRGKNVLTWWRGTVDKGHGEGEIVMLDSSYKQIATIQAGNGLTSDLHDCTLTDDGTALITIYENTRTDLTSVGGTSNGHVLDSLVQEVDVATGEVLFEWKSLDHVALSESESTVDKDPTVPFDYFHINSTSLAPNGQLLVSARNTCAVYLIDRTTGEITWRIGGRRSDFELGDGARFWWQHDANMPSSTQLTLFDDASSPPKEKQSRGLVLNLDTPAMKATVHREYTHPAALLADNQGSLQQLPDGNVVVGWGAEPYFTEYTADGEMLRDARLPENVQSYRAYGFDWVGRPTTKPAIAVGPNAAKGSTVYMSWNGATEVVRWRVLAGTSPTDLSPVGEAMHGSFETVVAVNSEGPHFAAVALDESGTEIGRSAVVTLSK